MGLFVDGKTGQRPLIARDRAIRPLERQLELNPNIHGQTLDEVIEAKLDEYVFVTRLGTCAARANLSRAFEALLTKLKIIYGADGKKRTLYSWRHFYATLDLQRGVSTHALSRQMDNSTGVLDRFYSKLPPFMNPGLHSGRDQQAQRETQKPASGTEQGPANNSDAEGVQGEVLQDASTPDLMLAPAEPATAPKTSANGKAFDLFEAGTLSEAALLIAVGTIRNGYQLKEDLRVRALTAFEAGVLSEDALVKLLS